VAWLLAVLVLPLLGALVYLVARPQPADTVIDTRAQGAGTDAGSVADEVAKLDRLRKEGVLSDAEFHAQKDYLLDLPRQRPASTSPADRASR
jgi:hypothetical protein